VSTELLRLAAVRLQNLHADGAGHLEDVVAQLGGWPAVLEGWRALGPEHALLASVWEVRDVLTLDTETIADRLGIGQDAVLQLVWGIESNVTTGRLVQAAAIAGSVAAAFADHWGRIAASTDDEGVARVAAWWQRHWECTASADSSDKAL
jgi:hypothetical protein